MATTNRRPFSQRPLQIPQFFSPVKATRTASGSIKRPRSPDQLGDANLPHLTSKRARATLAVATTRDDDKTRKRAEREQEFKDKYTRAFPSWNFYFDLNSIDTDSAARNVFEAKIKLLGGAVDDFFSKDITHLITDQPVPTENVANKENQPQAQLRQGSFLKSPIKLKSRAVDEYDHLVVQAVGLGKKIWTTAKLESVLGRCLDAPPVSSYRPLAIQSVPQLQTISNQRVLSRLLQSERLHGTSERDPSQKRHDFRYFSRSTYFLLVEDMRQELATIAAQEYPIPKVREGAPPPKVPWPVLHCHPKSRSPFVAFDEKEKRRWEKTQQAEIEKEDEREQRRIRKIQMEAMLRKAEANQHANRVGDLRRSVSMNNLRRRSTNPDDAEFLDGGFIDLDADFDSANASGYLASGVGGYMAASGNSVGITSTTGTTSTATTSFRTLQLPAALQGRIQQQVVTSRKFSAVSMDKGQGRKSFMMGPPAEIPARPSMLRKSRSTNTLRLPKRQEGSKPGYCESCRVKFDDFKFHVKGRKHRKFALDEDNFLQLDTVLDRVKRRTLEEVHAEALEREANRGRTDDYYEDDEYESPDELALSPQDHTLRVVRRPVWDDDMDQDMEPHSDVDLDA